MIRNAIAVGATALVATLLLAACTHATTSEPSAAPTRLPSSSASATPVSSVPTYNAKGTAEQNLAYFDVVGHKLFDHHGDASGKVIVDWFVSNGFAKKEMEITPDKTSIGLQAWNIEFSVNMNGTCLIGQSGNVGFQSAVEPLLATGKCLIGATRKIDW